MPTEPTGGDTRAILAAGLDPAKPEDAIAATVARVSNWGRWGADDVLGTLNLLDDAKRVEGARLVRRGAAEGAVLEGRLEQHAIGREVEIRELALLNEVHFHPVVNQPRTKRLS